MRLLLQALVFLLLFAPSPARAQYWAEFRPPGIGYSVELPGEWKIETEEVKTAVGNVKAVIATAGLNDRAYLTMYNSYPEASVRERTITQMLDGARDGGIKNAKGKLRNEERILVSNLPARQLIVDCPNNIVLLMRFFMLKNTLVQAAVAGPPGVETEPDTTRTLMSLKVTAP